MDKEKKQSLIWLVKFWGALAFFYWLHGTRWIEEAVLKPFAVATAVVTRSVLPRIGMQVEQTGTTIRTGERMFEIAGSCTGTLVIFLFAAAVLSFPTSWKSRLRGLLIGLAGITLLNFVRTLIIVVVTSKFPDAFWMLHVVIGQAVVIVGTVGIYLWWMNQSSDIAYLPKGRREAAKTTALFFAGFVFGYAAYYFVFLNGPVGVATRELIGRHAAALLSFGFDASYRGEIIQTSGTAIRLEPECLSSPMVVLFSAVTMALPVAFWKKLLAAVLGFWPVFYLYHLFSTVAIVISLTGGGATSESFVYIHMQQLVLAPLLLFFAAYYDRAGGDFKLCGKEVLSLALWGVGSIPLAMGFGFLFRELFLPALTQWISGTPELFLATHEPQTSHVFGLNSILRTVPDFEIAIWLILSATEPSLSVRDKVRWATAGLPVFFLHGLAAAAAVELFHLLPNAFLLQTWIVIVPFAVFYGIKKYKPFIEKKKEESHGGMHLLQDR